VEAIDIEESCRRCGYPLVGNETYCSHCGLRLEPRSFSSLAVALVLLGMAALATARTCTNHVPSLPPSRARPPAIPTRLAS
jgi:hypothetical protein